MKTMFKILTGLALFSTSTVVDSVLGAASLGLTASHFPTVISNCSNDVPPIPPSIYFPSFGPKIVGTIKKQVVV
jgi:hypothetical protein